MAKSASGETTVVLSESEVKVVKEALEMYLKSCVRASKAAPNELIADAWRKGAEAVQQLAAKF